MRKTRKPRRLLKKLSRPRGGDRRKRGSWQADRDLVSRRSFSIRPGGMSRRSFLSRTTSRSCRCRRNRPSSIRSRTSGSSCAPTGSRTASSNPTTTFSTTAASPGTSSSTCPGKSSPSEQESGPIGRDQRDLVALVEMRIFSGRSGLYYFRTDKRVNIWPACVRSGRAGIGGRL